MKATTAKPAAARTRSRNKREEVLGIASNCFLSNGYDGTSINVMARDAGISKESIYRYFGSKEDLFKCVIERELEVYQKGMEDTAGDFQKESIEQALLHVAENTLKLLTNERAQALRRLIFHMAANGSRVGRHYYQVGPQVAYQNLRRIFEHHLEGRPQQDKASGLKAREGFTTEKLSIYFMGMILHPTTLERECGLLGELSTREVRRRAREIIADFLRSYCEPA